MRVVDLRGLKDPFDHSKCGHEQPYFPVELSDRMRFDLVRILHILWLDIANGRNTDALILIEELGRLVQLSALGLENEINDEVDRTKAYQKDITTLHSDEFDAELRRLYEEGKGE